MSKLLKAIRSTSGLRDSKEVSISVSDQVYDLLKDYDIDIMDHKIETHVCSIYIIKDGVDKYSVTFNPNNNTFTDAIKNIVEKVKEGKN